jgi:8-oxo-dGTP diphosphatase
MNITIYSCRNRTQVVERMVEAFSIRLIDALETDKPRIRIHDGQHLLS